MSGRSFCSAVACGSDSCKFWQGVGATHHTIVVLARTESNYIVASWSLHVGAAAVMVAATHLLVNAGAWVRSDSTEASAVPASATISSLSSLSFTWSEEATCSLVHVWMG